jgi:3-polyprenyl-4-hydroxybenzoate decarboxylase
VPFLAEMDPTARDPARSALTIRTLEPLSFGTRHVIAIRRSARSAANAELPASPGFYHGATSVADLVDFVVARICDQLGVANTLMRRWGEAT